MQRKYAIVYPAFSFVGDGLADMPFLIVAPVHWLMYERICGYSLGHAPTFYDSLDDAKRTCSWQDAIIEFNVETSNISNLLNIYTISKFKESMREVTDTEVKNSGYQGRFFEKCKMPVWECREIHKNDLTAHGLDTLNKSYQIFQQNLTPM